MISIASIGLVMDEIQITKDVGDMSVTEEVVVFGTVGKYSAK
jgi:hypothetical protein